MYKQVNGQVRPKKEDSWVKREVEYTKSRLLTESIPLSVGKLRKVIRTTGAGNED